MKPTDQPSFDNPILKTAWESMPTAMRETVSKAPLIPAIAARAKAAVSRYPDFIRGDQGQVVGILPEHEVYYGPSSGLVELRSLVARFWTLAYNLEGQPGIPEGGLRTEHVGIVSGATEGLAILLRLFAPGRKVGLQRLYWGNYRNIVKHAGGEPVVIDYFGADGSLDVEGIAKTITANEIQTLVLNFPANPTGDCLTDDELAKIGALAREKNLILIADEVYNWIRYDHAPRTLLSIAPERTIVIGAASKEYLMPGARTAWVVSTNTTFSNEWLPRLIRATSSSPNVLGQRLVLDMLGPDVEDFEVGQKPRLLGLIKEELHRRRDLMVEVLQSTGFQLVGRRNEIPQGGISLLARLPDGLDDDSSFVDRGINLGKFSAIPGSAFGAPGCIRFGYAGMNLDNIERLRGYLRDVAEAEGGSAT